MDQDLTAFTFGTLAQEITVPMAHHTPRFEVRNTQKNHHELQSTAPDNCESAYGFFQVYESMAPYTKAGFLQDPQLKTPVFVSFSHSGFNSTEAVRNTRGFAVKFYTQEGDYDLIGQNIPVLFSQNALGFSDCLPATLNGQPKNPPQTTDTHNQFWDFVSSTPEAIHMTLWMMSDRAIPRSLRMMEGFGVHTFQLVNELGVSSFVKFHWKPLLGAHSLVWDEATKLANKDANFYRRDLWEAIEAGDYPEWELGVQIIPEEDQFKFEFDLFDPTKLIPEEVVPVIRIGKMTLNRHPHHFFNDAESRVFHPKHLVSGIDLSHGSENADTIAKNNECLIGNALADHFSQATLFWRSQSQPEQQHIIEAFRWELEKVTVPAVRERMLVVLSEVNMDLATQVARSLNMASPAPKPAKRIWRKLLSSPALSMMNSSKNSVKTRKVAILVADGVDGQSIIEMKSALEKAGVKASLVAEHAGTVTNTANEAVVIDYSMTNMPSVMFDAIFIPDGEKNIATLLRCSKAILFILEAYKHGKSIAVMNDGKKMLTGLSISNERNPVFTRPDGIIAATQNISIADLAKDFIAAIAQHRHWARGRSIAIDRTFNVNTPNLTPLMNC